MTATLVKPADHSDRVTDQPRMTIGFVMHVMQVAGAEMLVAEMVRKLQQSIDPVIICLDEVGQLGRELQAEGVDVVSLDRRPGIDWRVPGRIAKIVSDRGIQILHAHQYTPFFYSALSRVAGAPSKIIFTEHGRHYPDVVSAKRRWANRLVLRKFADRTTACCQFAGTAVEENDGFTPGSVEVLPNGIDLTKFSQQRVPKTTARARLGFADDLCYLSTVARFHPVKDHATLIHAFSQVTEAAPSTRLLLVGDGPERARMESLVRQLGLRDKVEFTGIRQDVADILSASDIFVLPSLSEAASLTLLEAMACAAAVVVTDVGGNPEIVRRDRDGLLTPRQDADRMAAAILRLVRDPNLRQDLGESACQRVAEKYDLTSILQQYLALYRDVAGERA